MRHCALAEGIVDLSDIQTGRLLAYCHGVMDSWASSLLNTLVKVKPTAYNPARHRAGFNSSDGAEIIIHSLNLDIETIVRMLITGDKAHAAV